MSLITKKYSEVIYFVNLLNSLDFSDKPAKAQQLALVCMSDNAVKAKVLAEAYLTPDKESETKPERAARKAAEAVLRVIDKDVLPDYNDEVEDIRVDHCAVDATSKVILKDSKGLYEFTKDGTKSFKKDVKALGKKEVTFELKPVAKEVFSNISEDVVEYLTAFGFLF